MSGWELAAVAVVTGLTGLVAGLSLTTRRRDRPPGTTDLEERVARLEEAVATATRHADMARMRVAELEARHTHAVTSLHSWITRLTDWLDEHDERLGQPHPPPAVKPAGSPLLSAAEADEFDRITRQLREEDGTR